MTELTWRDVITAAKPARTVKADGVTVLVITADDLDQPVTWPHCGHVRSEANTFKTTDGDRHRERGRTCQNNFASRWRRKQQPQTEQFHRGETDQTLRSPPSQPES